MARHRAAHPLDSPCSVCTAPSWVRCKAVDGVPLPDGVTHPERTEPTPLHDTLTVTPLVIEPAEVLLLATALNGLDLSNPPGSAAGGDGR